MTEQNPENLSSDELENLIEEASDAGEGFPDLHNDVVSVDQEPVDPEPVEDPQDQLNLDGDDADAEPVEADEIDVLRRELELAEKRARHFESKLGGAAGRAGFLESRVQELEEQLARVADAQNTLAYEHANPSRTQPRPAPDPVQQPVQQQPQQVEIDPARARAAAIDQAEANFFSLNPDLVRSDPLTGQVEVDAGFRAALEARREDVQRLTQVGDPGQVQIAAQRILAEARDQAMRQQMDRRQADSAGSLKAKKRAAAVSGDAGTSGAVPPRGPKDPSTLSMKDLTELIEKME